MYILNTKGEIGDSKYSEIANGYLEVKKSKFYSYIFSIENKEQIEEILSAVKKDNRKARHVLYAYEFMDNGTKIKKFSNDGEPSGTGVNSVISMLEKEEVTGYLVVIVRYFGGILLGSGPLLRTYLNSFKEAYAKCEKVEKIK